MEERVCTLVNGQFSWFLRVDGEEIPFNYAKNADYFEKHYTELGYKVIRVTEQA